MKLFLKILWISLLSLTLLSTGYAEDPLHISTSEYPPEYSEKYKYHGLTPHIVTEAFALQNMEAKWSFVPWARARRMAEKLQSDGSCCWAKTDDRLKYFLYSDPVQSRTYVLFHLKEYSFDWNNLKDLKKIPIGATNGYTYGSAFKKAEKSGDIHVEWAASDTVNFKKLLAGRIKLFALSIKVGYATIAKAFSEEEAKLFTHHGKPFYTYQNHLIVSVTHPKGPLILHRFNQGLKDLIASGKYDQFHEESKRGDYINTE